MPKSLVENFVEQFRLCQVKPDEVVAIISEVGEKEDYVRSAVAAARQLGASALVLQASSLSNPMLPPYQPDGREVPALLAAAGEADFVVDCTVGGLIHSDVRTRITGNGKRMLFVAEPNDVLERLMGGEEIKAAATRAGDTLRAGHQLHVTSAAGTDLCADISGEDLPITLQWGYVDVPGRWDHWPSGFAACFPKDRSAQGTIVLQPGDALIPWQRYVRDETVLTVKDGFITDISGGADARTLNDYFESWDDPEVWALSHMGWGLLPTARWSAFDVYDPRTLYGQELRSTAGNFMWSTGSNRFANRETPAHLDVPMRNCTVRIDDVAVVVDGKLVD